jgi:hypothetical protein
VTDEPEALARSCIAELQDALGRPPVELSSEVDRVEQQLARLRERLIVDLRREPAGPSAAAARTALDRVNAALSLVVGVEYPAAGIQRTLLEQARDALHDLVRSGALAER